MVAPVVIVVVLIADSGVMLTGSGVVIVVCSGAMLVVGPGVAEPLTAVPLTATELFRSTYSPRAQSYFREQSCQIVTTLRQGPPGGPTYPFLHTQLVRDLLPITDVVSAGHVRQ